MALEESGPMSHPTDNTVTSDYTTVRHTEEIFSIPDMVKYCSVVQAGATMWCKSPRQPWRQDYSFIYHKTQMKLCYLYRYRARSEDRQTFYISRRLVLATDDIPGQDSPNLL